jgi:hypothetical protein
MSSRVPRKQRNLKAAAKAAEDASVELNSSNCSEGQTLESVNQYEFFGFGKAGQTYTQGQNVNWGSDEDRAKQTTGKNARGIQINLKADAGDNVLANSIAAKFSTQGNHHYFSATGTGTGGVTGSSIVNFIYSKNGPQAEYVPQLVGGQGSAYAFFLPSTVTGTEGANLPATANRSFAITIAGACAPGERVQVYTASSAGKFVETGSTFGHRAADNVAACSTPNYSTQTIYIPTGSLGIGPNRGIVVAFTSSYTANGVSENTPYAGVVVKIYPSNLITGSAG